MTNTETHRRDALRYIFSQGVLKRNLLVALIVGCVLSLANQWEVMFRGPFTPRLGVKLLFNFLTPFVVSSVSAAINRHSR
jgi:hypothetical protein